MVLLEYETPVVFRVAPYSVVKKQFPEILLEFYEKFLVVGARKNEEEPLDMCDPAKSEKLADKTEPEEASIVTVLNSR
jgi:hypothetical protein